MKSSDLRLLITVLLALAAPAGLLTATLPDERLQAGLTAAPFAWPRLLLAHLLTALPLGLLLAARLQRSAAVRTIPALIWPAVGVLAGLALLIAGPELGDVIASLALGESVAVAARAGCALLLVLPWCLAGLRDLPGSPTHWGLWPLTVLTALLPAGLYADGQITTRTRQVEEYLEHQRPVRAARLLLGLREAGSTRPIRQESPQRLEAELTRQLIDLRRRGDRTLPANATGNQRLERALLLLQLDRLDEAQALLEALPDAGVPVQLLLATLHRDRGDWPRAGAIYERVRSSLVPRLDRDATLLPDLLTATEGLALSLVRQGQPSAAERLLREGLEQFPAQAAWFHFRLGQYYADAGRPGPALHHLHAAAEADPKQYGTPAAARIEQLRVQTPGCVLPR